ncbi:hypothetical protein SAMN05660429_00292 [Thalassotalea agarivorans]|uniref:Uncharacterized protein n=1 Tax=Thalassotalea agarivorans TaxID=349064 RepID=A0A1H9YNN6_THASX|nr:hypothetical protein SAMN05660429_00292 [Thalassotalea agarivorans]
MRISVHVLWLTLGLLPVKAIAYDWSKTVKHKLTHNVNYQPYWHNYYEPTSANWLFPIGNNTSSSWLIGFEDNTPLYTTSIQWQPYSKHNTYQLENCCSQSNKPTSLATSYYSAETTKLNNVLHAKTVNNQRTVELRLKRQQQTYNQSSRNILPKVKNKSPYKHKGINRKFRLPQLSNRLNKRD